MEFVFAGCDFKVYDLGLVDYQRALRLQKEIFLEVKKEILSAALILCQHYPVITLGRRARAQDLLCAKKKLAQRGIDIFVTDRGGGITYHGPGQLLVYPIINLGYFKKDIHLFLRALERMVICLLARFGISARALPDYTGVWVDEKKIASIGVAIKNWISYHGLSINIKKGDLVNFNLIRPCGLDIIMTSLESILGREVAVDEVKRLLPIKPLNY
jgi:lipoate-protein ligase B